jgi:single-strand DNA-binding protein
MSGSLNKVTLIGHLGADPDVRTTQDGRQIVNLRLATTESWKDKQTGERRDKTEWHSVVIFSEGLARVASQYLKKGSKVYIEGQLQTRKWQDKDGHDRYTTEIILQNFNSSLILLDSRPSSMNNDSSSNTGFSGNASFNQNNQSRSQGNTQKSSTTSHQQNEGSNFSIDLNDDIPF